MKKTFGVIIQVIIIAYIIVFSMSNRNNVEINFFIGTPSYVLPLFMLILCTLFIGFIFGVILVSIEKISLNSRIKKLTKQASEYQEEILRLKNITVSGTSPIDSQDSSNQQKQSEVNSDIKNILR